MALQQRRCKSLGQSCGPTNAPQDTRYLGTPEVLANVDGDAVRSYCYACTWELLSQTNHASHCMRGNALLAHCSV